METSLHEAKESAKHKESKIIKLQKELEMTNDVVAKLQAQVNESNKCLEKTKEMIQVLQVTNSFYNKRVGFFSFTVEFGSIFGTLIFYLNFLLLMYI